MHLLSKAKSFFHKPPTKAAHSAPGSKAAQPKPIPRLEIRRDGRELKGRRAPAAPLTLRLVDIGSEVQACLQDIDGLDFRGDDYTIVALSKLREGALDRIVEAIDILMNSKPRGEEQLSAACTLIRMLEPSARPALLDRCSGHLNALVHCQDARVRKAMDQMLYVACRDALGTKDFSRFLKLLPYCSPPSQASLIERFPPLTIEMAKALDEKMLIRAVDVRVQRIKKLNSPEALLIEHESLLSIAGDLQEFDLPRAVVMKCIVWECLSTDGVPDPVVLRRLKELQCKALLPALSPTLVKRMQDELKLDLPGVVEEQGALSPNLKAGLDRLPVPATPIHEFFDFLDAKDAGELNKAATLIHRSQNDGFRQVASGELLAAVSQRLEEEGFDLGSEPGRYIQALLEGFGFPSRDGPLNQMIAALPMLCDADHSFMLHVILTTDRGKELVAQALTECLLKRRYGDATIASLVMALADRVGLQSILGQDRWDSATTRLVIDLLMSGVRHEAEAAEKILAHGSAIAGESLRAQMRDLLPKLCDADPAIELDLILRTELGERLVAQAVEDYLLQGELDNASVSSLFKALAHRVDLRTTELFSIDAAVALSNLRESMPIAQKWGELFKRLGRVQLDGRCTWLLDQWGPGWRLLLLPCVEKDFFTHKLPLALHGILSVKAIDAAAADAVQGGAKEKMDLAALGGRVQRALEAMLSISVGGEPLLSDDALINVMRAIVSSGGLAKATLTRVRNLSADDQMKVYKALAYALIILRDDVSECRFDGDRPANHAVKDVALLMEGSIPRHMKAKYQEEKWWRDLVFHGLLPADPVPEIRIQTNQL